MEWGLFLVTTQPPGMSAEESITNSVVYATSAEKFGFDTAWVLEHHFTRYGLVGSPLLHAAFVLGATSSLRVGTAIQVIALDHPVRLAEQVALVDQLSGGRLMFGFGRGVFTKDFTVFDRDMNRSRELVEEWLGVMKAAWTTGRCKGDGPNVKFPEIEIFPPPLTKPHPPLYTVAQSPESIDWAARNNLPLIHTFGYSDDQIVAVLDQYDSAAERAGHDPTTVPHVLSMLAGVSGDGSKIREASREHIGWWVDEGLRAADLGDQLGYEWFRRRTDEAILRGERSGHDRVTRYFANSPIGSPQECIDRLNQTVETTGITRFALGFEGAGDRQAVMDSMQQFAEHVMPHVGVAPQESRRTVAQVAL